MITGGDYDFVLADLVDYLAGKGDLPKGVWYRESGRILSSGDPDLSHDLNELPLIDRELTQWRRYAYKSGNFKHTAGNLLWYAATTKDAAQRSIRTFYEAVKYDLVNGS